MSASPRPLPFPAAILQGLIIVAVPLAAFLAFSIQPLMGKLLLPAYGGTSGTWLGCMVYFQLALLLGYAWAAWLVSRSPTFQTLATTALGLLAAVCFHAPGTQTDEAASIVRVVARLALSNLPAMVLLFSTSPLLHAWLRRRGEAVPYHLYAISNAGSLAAVALYPFAWETALRVSEQLFFWHGLLVVLAGVLALAGYALRHANPAPAAAEPPEEKLTPKIVGAWLWLSALTCVGMLGATYHLAAEMGSGPLAWVGPFGVYLLSFMVTFSGRWVRWMTVATLAWLAVSLAGFMVAKGFGAATVNHTAAWWLVSLTASGSFLGNALLHGLRPARRFERFYLVLAAGGVLGGLLSGVVIPYLLPHPVEFALASAALLTTGLLWLTETRKAGVAAVLACVVFAPVLLLGRSQARPAARERATVVHLRDLYGHLMLKTDAHSVVLSSDTTTHGSQLTADEASRRRPTLYYTESSGVGRVLEKLQATRPQLNVGVIGLGAGTLAAYARADDVVDFWDIDPKALRVAREHFTFVAESAGKVNLILRDGRKALEASAADYDVIVIDAFTGDGIPSHLLTREALSVYFRRLAVRQGLLVFHASTRYSTLFPVIDATARSLGQASLDVVTDITESAPARDWDPTRTEYVIVGPLPRIREVAGWFAAEEDGGRVKHQLTTVNSPLIRPRFIWSDERNAAIDSFELAKFLLEP